MTGSLGNGQTRVSEIPQLRDFLRTAVLRRRQLGDDRISALCCERGILVFPSPPSNLTKVHRTGDGSLTVGVYRSWPGRELLKISAVIRYSAIFGAILMLMAVCYNLKRLVYLHRAGVEAF